MDRIDGICKGQIWTGKSGMGPQVRITGIDLLSGRVLYDYADPAGGHLHATAPIATFLQSYRPETDA